MNLRLFDRTTHHLSVTDKGRDILERIATPLRNVEDVLALTAGSTQAKGAVEISVPGRLAPVVAVVVRPRSPSANRREKSPSAK